MKALLVIDVQNDFMPWGALPVRNGDKIIPAINVLMNDFDLVVATKDWHPQNHGSFAINHPGKSIGNVIQLDGLEQILWPEHCVQGTFGAEFAEDLNQNGFDAVFTKGGNRLIDSYSAFFDNAHRHETGLAKFLRANGVTQVFISGLATDYCVKFTALDAVALNFETFLLYEACAGVELQVGDIELACHEMLKKGIKILEEARIAS